MTSRDDDETWRSIVENYGERPILEPEPAPEPAPGPDPVEDLSAYDDVPVVEAQPYVEEGYTPPEAPAVTLPEGPRLVAWLGLLGAPVVLVVLMLAGAQVGPWMVLLLVTAFVGGFGYLVATMSREPRDPWDDGSRL